MTMICTIQQHPFLFQELPTYAPDHMSTQPPKTKTPSKSIPSHASASQASFAELNVHDIPSEKITCVEPEQRRLAMQDVHAVFETQAENKAFMEAKLNDLEAAITKLDASDRMAYDEARQQNAEYVDSFRLAFLRAEHYDANRAAQRTVGHFAARLDLFKTTDVLSRDIVPFDLRPEQGELSSFERATGISRMELLADCDRAGRPIILVYPAKSSGDPRNKGNDDVERHLLMLSTMVANLGESAQKNGLVILWFGHGISSPAMARDEFRFLSLLPVLPVRVGAVHACHNDSRYTEIFSRMMDMAAPQDILRFQSHYGNPRQCLQSLCRFGIPPQILEDVFCLEDEQFSSAVGTPSPHRHTPAKSLSMPAMMHPPSHRDPSFSPQIERSLVSGSRSICSTIIRTQSIQSSAAAPASSCQLSRTQEEKHSSYYLMIDSPSENDIFLGKGKRSKRLRGNLLFRQAVEQHAQAYSAGERLRKIEVLQVIYAQLKDAGCRFLKGQNRSSSTKQLWMELSEEEALAKIAMGIRNHRRKLQGATPTNTRRRRRDDSSSSISSNDSS